MGAGQSVSAIASILMVLAFGGFLIWMGWTGLQTIVMTLIMAYLASSVAIIFTD